MDCTSNSSAWVHQQPDIQNPISYLENPFSVLLFFEMTSHLGRKDCLPVLNIPFPQTLFQQQLCQSILLFWSIRGAVLLAAWPITPLLLPPQFVPLMGRGINALPVTAAQETVMSEADFESSSCKLHASLSSSVEENIKSIKVFSNDKLKE